MQSNKQATSTLITSAKRFLKLPKSSLTWFEKVWLFAPVAMWFSYQPLLRLGKSSSTNFELSITMVFVLLLALVGLPKTWQHKTKLASNKAVCLVSAFWLLSAFSLLWTPDLTRGILTLGVISLLYAIFIAAIAQAKRLRIIAPCLVRIFITSAVIMSVLAFVQVLTAVWLGRSSTLLCAGCSPEQFGFARPNVFAIEPQFFGNMLLAPALVLLHQLFNKKQAALTIVSFLIVVTALFLTLSRGAIFAFGIGALLLVILELRNVKTALKVGAYVLMSSVVCLLVQGGAAAANNRVDTTFMGAVSASVNQLTLGVVDIHKDQPSPALEPVNEQNKPANASVQNINNQKVEKTPNFDGYVEESTNVRLTLSRLSLQSWSGDGVGRVMFGVGLGGSGVTLRNEHPTQVNNREIVQNEYMELLLENGLLGLSIFTALIGGLLYKLRVSKWQWAIVLVFLVQWNFFSGYPNALHMYLIFILLYMNTFIDHNKA